MDINFRKVIILLIVVMVMLMLMFTAKLMDSRVLENVEPRPRVETTVENETTVPTETEAETTVDESTEEIFPEIEYTVAATEKPAYIPGASGNGSGTGSHKPATPLPTLPPATNPSATEPPSTQPPTAVPDANDTDKDNWGLGEF